MARAVCFDSSASDIFGESYATHLTQRRGTWLLLGLRRYHNEHGAWPETLDAITEYVPADAFDDPTSVDRFVYALDEDGFTLYSKGVNRIDEGGRNDWNEARDTYEDDIAIWPPHVRKPRPQTKESMDEMMKQLAEIYGERYLKDTPDEPNDR
jgi:hypothetical protein